MNVAYHLNQLGCPALPVSAVGDDADGRALLSFLSEKGLSTQGVARSSGRPTGVVDARIDDRGNAHYTIRQDVAWDEIPLGGAVPALAAAASALVFGSLAQRSAVNRESLARLRSAVPAGALQIFDVNLRDPYDDLDLVRSLARGAGVIKCNHEEAARWTGGPEGDLENNARRIARESGVKRICLTAGPRGAGLLLGDVWSQEAGRPVTVVDTVGAGDAFLAALVEGLRAHRPAEEILARACRLGEFVAGQSGATPAYDPAAVFNP